MSSPGTGGPTGTVWTVVSLALALALPAQAAPERRSASDFRLRAVVTGEPASGEAHAVPLSPEAVSALSTGGELRLFDADGREIPSLVHTARARAEQIRRPVEIFDRAWLEDGTQTLSLELPSGAEPIDELFVEIPEDHHLIVRVEGSPDGDDWRIVADGLHLIRHSVAGEDTRYVHDRLRIPTARFAYYRLGLRPLATPPPGSEPLRVAQVSVQRSLDRGASLTLPVSVERLEDPRDRDPRHSWWRLELPHPGLGIDRIDLELPGDDFARSASLWVWSPQRGRRTLRLASSVVFRFGDEANVALDGFQTDEPTLALMIDQGDDAPVPLRGARAHRPRQTLRFIAPAEARPPLALHFEPDEPHTPRYDLARRLREHEIDRFARLAHGPLEPNPDYRPTPEPRSERLPWLLYLLVIPLVLVLGAYVVRSLQRGLPDEPREPDRDGERG